MIDWIIDYWRPIAASIVGLAVIVALCIWAADDQGKWEAHCRSIGGHVTSQDHVATGIGANGKPVVTVSTDYFCLTTDGRILDTR